MDIRREMGAVGAAKLRGAEKLREIKDFCLMRYFTMKKNMLKWISIE